MWGKYEPMLAKGACVSLGFGWLLLIVGVVAKLCRFAPMGSGPRSYAIAAGLMFLLTIAINSCLHARAERGR